MLFATVPACGWFGAPEAQPPDDLRCPGSGGGCLTRIEGATFAMGAQSTDPSAPGYDAAALPDEAPVHRVTVSTFWLFTTEVQTSVFRHCVEAGACRAEDADPALHAFDDPALGSQPMVGVSWRGAADACRFLGARLPTEAEWELAARGPGARRFPWGDTPTCHLGRPEDHVRGGQAASGCADPALSDADPWAPNEQGVRDLSSGVWEWVQDVYAPDAYAHHEARDPKGPAEGALRVQRGGAWTSEDPLELRSAGRLAMPAETRMVDVGFRCAWP